MSLIFSLFNCKVAAGNKAIDDGQATLRAGFSLAIIWGAALIVCIVFYISFSAIALTQPKRNQLLLIQQQQVIVENNATNQQVNETSAFVFVNLNKKFILTRFPAGSPDEANDVTGITTEGNRGSMDTQNPIVIRKVKTSNKKNSYTDFSIKPVPQ